MENSNRNKQMKKQHLWKKLNELKTMILDSWGYHQYCVIQDQHKRAIKYKIEDIVDVINSIDYKDIALIHYNLFY